MEYITLIKIIKQEYTFNGTSGNYYNKEKKISKAILQLDVVVHNSRFVIFPN